MVLSKQLQQLHAGISSTIMKEDALFRSPSLEDASVSEAGIEEKGLVEIAEMPITAMKTKGSQTHSERNNGHRTFDTVDSSFGANVEDESSVETMTLLSDEETNCSIASLILAGAIEVHQQPQRREEADADRKYSFSTTESSVVECDDTVSSTCWTSSDSEHEASHGVVSYERTSDERLLEPPGILATQEACWIPPSEDLAETDDEDYSSSGSSLTCSTRENDDADDSDYDEGEEQEQTTNADDGEKMSSDDELNALVAAMLKDSVTKEDLALTVSLHSIAEEAEEEQQQQKTTKETTKHNAASHQQKLTTQEREAADENCSSPKSSETGATDGYHDNNVITNEIKATPAEHKSNMSDEPEVSHLSKKGETQASLEAKAIDKEAHNDPDTDILESDSVDLSTTSVECGPVDIDSGAFYTGLMESGPVDLDDGENDKIPVARGPVDLDTGVSEIERVELDHVDHDVSLNIQWSQKIMSTNRLHRDQILLDASTAMEATAALKDAVDKREREAFAEAVAEALTEEAKLRVPFNADISGEKTHFLASDEHDEHIFCEFQTREQQLSDLELRNMPLEAVLLRRFDLGFQEAASLVSDARINIGASKWEPWTDELYDECQMLYSLKFVRDGQAKDTVVIMDWPKFLAPGHGLRIPADANAETASSSGNSVGSAASAGSRNFESSTGWSSVWDGTYFFLFYFVLFIVSYLIVAVPFSTIGSIEQIAMAVSRSPHMIAKTSIL